MPEHDTYWKLPHGFVIFCDDLRQEVGGKVSLMGVYNGFMFTGLPFPTQIARLGIYMNYFEPAELELTPLSFKVILTPDAEEPVTMIESQLDAPALPPPPAAAHLAPSEKTRRSFAQVIILNSIQLAKPSTLKVRAYRGDEEVRLGTLRIESQPPATVVANAPKTSGLS
jgi:hypothetical protein